jgi:hypothetical protein
MTSPWLCQPPNVGNPRGTIERVAHGVSAASDHLHALRASAYICAESFLVSRCHRSRDAGRDHRRSQPVAASSVAALISGGKDPVAGSRKSSPCRCLTEDPRRPARILTLVNTEFHRADSYWRVAPESRTSAEAPCAERHLPSLRETPCALGATPCSTCFPATSPRRRPGLAVTLRLACRCLQVRRT